MTEQEYRAEIIRARTMMDVTAGDERAYWRGYITGLRAAHFGSRWVGKDLKYLATSNDESRAALGRGFIAGCRRRALIRAGAAARAAGRLRAAQSTGESARRGMGVGQVGGPAHFSMGPPENNAKYGPLSPFPRRLRGLVKAFRHAGGHGAGLRSETGLPALTCGCFH